jgi:hypothetical protein
LEISVEMRRTDGKGVLFLGLPGTYGEEASLGLKSPAGDFFGPGGGLYGLYSSAGAGA